MLCWLSSFDVCSLSTLFWSGMASALPRTCVFAKNSGLGLAAINRNLFVSHRFVTQLSHICRNLLYGNHFENDFLCLESPHLQTGRRSPFDKTNSCSAEVHACR